MLGDIHAGKSFIAAAYRLTNTISASNMPEAAVFDIASLGGTTIYELWDTAGHERYGIAAPMYLRAATIAILVFDLNNEASFNNKEKWYTEIKKDALAEVEVLVVRNKSDLVEQRKVSVDRGEAWALEESAFYMDFSTKTGPKTAIISKLDEMVNNMMLN